MWYASSYFGGVNTADTMIGLKRGGWSTTMCPVCRCYPLPCSVCGVDLANQEVVDGSAR